MQNVQEFYISPLLHGQTARDCGIIFIMKVYLCILPALLVAMAGWQASARTIPVPTQPVSPFADTEGV